MSGSERGQDLQQGFKIAMLKNMAGDGPIHDRQDPRRPWNVGMGYGVPNWDEDLANMAGKGRLALEKHCGVYQCFHFDKETWLDGPTWNLPAYDARVSVRSWQEDAKSGRIVGAKEKGLLTKRGTKYVPGPRYSKFKAPHGVPSHEFVLATAI